MHFLPSMVVYSPQSDQPKHMIVCYPQSDQPKHMYSDQPKHMIVYYPQSDQPKHMIVYYPQSFRFFETSLIISCRFRWKFCQAFQETSANIHTGPQMYVMTHR